MTFEKGTPLNTDEGGTALKAWCLGMSWVGQAVIEYPYKTFRELYRDIGFIRLHYSCRP